MIRVLVAIAEDPKVDAKERRLAAMDVVAVDAGRPATTQEVVKPESPQGPLVQMNFGHQPGTAWTPDGAYKAMIDGVIPADGNHEAFHRRQPVTVTAEPATAAPETVETSAAPEPSNAAVEGVNDKRIQARSTLRDIVEGL